MISVRARSVLALSVFVFARAEAQQPEGATSSVPFATIQHIGANDSSEEIVAKAARVLPRPNQTEWMRLERTFFIHFGPNTFRGVEWGNGHEDPSVFNPSQLDADQWMRAVKQGGGKEVILVCKHHDGFALWPSRYTSHSVAASPWKSGKGDEVREVANAARKYGIALGVYLSPADLYQLKTNASNRNGYYGDGSRARPSVIPTAPASFLDDPSKKRATAAGAPSFTYSVDDYNRYFLNQLYELLTEYGPIREVWFDGANPDPSVVEHYDYNAWYDMIRKLQPEAVIFGKGPDGRWVGNEDGVGRTTEWDVIPLPVRPEEFRWPDMTDNDLGSRAKLVPGDYLWWYAPETNAPILHGWFWAPAKECRTAAELVEMYYTSVGRNSNWLLNLSPDRRGLIPDDQIAQLRGMAAVLRTTFAVDLAKGATLKADSSSAGHAPSAALDGNLDSWWEPDAGHSRAELVLRLARQETFDLVSLQEAVDHRGQRIESFAVDAWLNGAWQQVTDGTTVGHKRLLRLKTPVTTTQIRVRILSSRLEPTIAEIGLFKQAPMVAGPSIAERDAQGMVALHSDDARPIIYTTNGDMPTPHSQVYRTSLDMRNGGTVQAATLTAKGDISMVTEKHFTGVAPIGWKVVDEAAAEASASNAIDGKPDTVWQSASIDRAGDLVPLTVDMGSARMTGGFTYLPREDGSHVGMVKRYRFETSEDGRHWRASVSDGRFDNMQNNPGYQEVRFAPVRVRYFRFTALETVGAEKAVSAAEVSVLPAGTEH